MTFLSGPPPPQLPIAKPYGLALKNGKLYVSDTMNGTVHIADLRHHTWDYFQPKGSGRLRKNIGLAVDNDGTLYVSDTQRGQVIIFDAAGNYSGVLGQSGELKPTAIEISSNRLFIADMKSQHILVFDKTTRTITNSIPNATTTNDAERLYQPVGLALDSEGHIYVSDVGSFRIQVYNPDGSYLRTIGKHGDRPGEFVRNKGIALDRAHRLYSIDAGFQLLQLYDEKDRMLMFFGEPDEAEGQMMLPADVIVDYDTADVFKKFVAPGYDLDFIVLVSNQYGDRKINVYGFIRREGAQTP